MIEIRDYCVPKDARNGYREKNDEDDDDDCRDDDDDYDGYDDDGQDRLYESISKGVGLRWQESTDDADTEDDVQLRHQQPPVHRIVAPAVGGGSRVKRKKSARRNIKYVVKPVRRAPSSASARRPSVTAKSKSPWISTSTCTKSAEEEVFPGLGLSKTSHCNFEKLTLKVFFFF